MATLFFQVLAASGMALVSWWLWRDEDSPTVAAPETLRRRPLLFLTHRRTLRDMTVAR